MTFYLSSESQLTSGLSVAGAERRAAFGAVDTMKLDADRLTIVQDLHLSPSWMDTITDLHWLIEVANSERLAASLRWVGTRPTRRKRPSDSF
jgi:hypothetical protein